MTPTKTSSSKSPIPKRVTAKRPSSSRWIFGGIVAVVVIAGIIAVVASSGGGSDSSDAAKNTSSGKLVEFSKAIEVNGTPLPAYSPTATDDAAVGKTAPDLSGQTFSGKTVSTTNTGKPRAVIFLAHWCPHCQAEVPRLVELAKSGALDGVDVTAVATGTRPDAVNYPPSAWLAGEDWPYPVIADTKDIKAGTAYGLTYFPYFVLIDGQGKVAGRYSGELTPDQIKALFTALAEGKPLPQAGSGASSGAG